MKKIYYLTTLIGVMLTSCSPLSKTYQNIDSAPLGSTLSLTLIPNDYKVLPTTFYGYNAGLFDSNSDANLYIPTILASKYPTAADQTNANVTFTVSPSYSTIGAPDSKYADIAITLAAADYVFPGNTATNLTSTTAISFLTNKYPTPAANQLVVMTYNYLETGVTATAGNTVTDTFAFLNGNWVKLYTVSPAQYASVNRGSNNWFIAGDPANLVTYFNSFLKNDLTVSATAKAGDIKYVSYRYTTTYQMTLALTYDGSNWQPRLTLSYLKLSGLWVPDPTVYVTEPALTNYGNADYQYLNTLTNIGNTSNRGNVAQYGDFSLQSTSVYYWPDADLTAALIAILLHKFSAPVVGVPYVITYYVYNGTTVAATKKFQFNGTTFVLQQ